MGSGTTLPTKANRNAYIKYLEQGLLITASLYRAGAGATNCRISLGGRLIDDVDTPVINIEAKIPVAATALKSGKPFDAINATVKTNQFPPTAIPVAPDTVTLAIPDEPSSITSHEKYLVWLGQTLQKAGADPKFCRVTYDSLTAIPVIIVNASLPYDPDVFIESGNLFQAVQQTVTSLTPSSGSGGSSGGGGGSVSPDPFIGNEAFMNNDFYLGN